MPSDFGCLYRCYTGAITGDELKAQLEKRGVGIGQLAAVLGVKQPTVSEWLSGKRTIPSEKRELYPGQKEEGEPEQVWEPSREQEIREILWDWSDEEIQSAIEKATRHAAETDAIHDVEARPEIRQKLTESRWRKFRLGQRPATIAKVPVKPPMTEAERAKQARIEAEDRKRRKGGPVIKRWMPGKGPTDESPD